MFKSYFMSRWFEESIIYYFLTKKNIGLVKTKMFKIIVKRLNSYIPTQSNYCVRRFIF